MLRKHPQIVAELLAELSTAEERVVQAEAHLLEVGQALSASQQRAESIRAALRAFGWIEEGGGQTCPESRIAAQKRGSNQGNKGKAVRNRVRVRATGQASR